MGLPDKLVRLIKNRFVVGSIFVFLALTFGLFSGVLGSFELVRYTGDDSVTHRQAFEYIHIDQNRDSIGINRLLEVKNALDDEYVYVDKLKDDVLQDLAIMGMISGLEDRYTRYIQSGYDDQISKLDGTLVGIGITVFVSDDNQTIIEETFPGGPADRAGLKENDVIVAVDGINVTQMALLDIASLIRGIRGSTVIIGIERSGQDGHMNYEIIRELVEMPSVYLDEIETGVYHISIPRFTDRTYDELIEILGPIVNGDLLELRYSLILDLRNNSGGYVETAKDVASVFMGPSVVFFSEDKLKNREPVKTTKDLIIPKQIRMVVLVNQRTASAGEIVAGALQDTGRYPLIGTNTYGKGAITTLKPIAGDSALYLTSALWYTPKLRSVDAKGLSPDIEVAELYQSMKVGTKTDIIGVAVEHLDSMEIDNNMNES
jgi:carboxyl-terminal processing protease